MASLYSKMAQKEIQYLGWVLCKFDAPQKLGEGLV